MAESNAVDVSEQELLERHPEVLRALLKDHSRTAYEVDKAQKEGRQPAKDQWNIIWGTNNYLGLGEVGFGEEDEITEEKITGKNRLLVRPRAVKEKEIQRQRVRDMAEVFTPAWVCNAQNNLVDEAWFGHPDAFNHEYVDKEGVHHWSATEGKIAFDEEPSPKSKRSWKDYVRDVRLEITCGEAPYLVSRYDSVTGLPEPDLNHRVGFLDRKLRIVSENTQKSDEWLEWAQEAVKSIYGFEWQGDNLLLAPGEVHEVFRLHHLVESLADGWIEDGDSVQLPRGDCGTDGAFRRTGKEGMSRLRQRFDGGTQRDKMHFARLDEKGRRAENPI